MPKFPQPQSSTWEKWVGREYGHFEGGEDCVCCVDTLRAKCRVNGVDLERTSMKKRLGRLEFELEDAALTVTIANAARKAPAGEGGIFSR